jgi:hypothetical protein
VADAGLIHGSGHVFRNVSELSAIRQLDKDLWGDQLLLVVSVHQLQQGLVTSGEDLYVRRIRITSEAYARTVFGRGDFDVGSALRIDEPKQDGFRVPGGAVRHLDGRIGWQDFHFDTNAATLVNELEFTTPEHGRDLLCRRSVGLNKLIQK